MKLRDYQLQSILEIQKAFQDGHKKVLLHLATGAGKTVVFSEMLKRTVAKSNRGGMVVRGKQLVDQTSRRLFKEDVQHGVIQANHWNKNYGAPIQICSIDTINARNLTFEDWKLLVIDEAHLATTGPYKKFIERFNGFIVSVTATPWGKESLAHLADVVVHPITTEELFDQGYLIPPKYYAPSAPDLKGVKTVAGEYDSEELEKRMNNLTGDIVDHYRDILDGQPTILFAVNISHSKMLTQRFQDAGISAEHVEGMTSLTERDEAIKRLERGETKVLCNVGVLCTGVDIPFLKGIIMARPIKKSYNLYIQQLGRGTRPMYQQGLETQEERLAAIQNSDKKNFIVLDHAGNVLRHGYMHHEPTVTIESEPKFKAISLKTCYVCFAVYQGFNCPSGCAAPLTKERDVTTVEIEGKLVELSEMPMAAKLAQDIERFKEIRKKRGYKKGWVYFQVKEKYGEEIANKFFPKRELPSWLSGRA